MLQAPNQDHDSHDFVVQPKEQSPEERFKEIIHYHVLNSVKYRNSGMTFQLLLNKSMLKVKEELIVAIKSQMNSALKIDGLEVSGFEVSENELFEIITRAFEGHYFTNFQLKNAKSVGLSDEGLRSLGVILSNYSLQKLDLDLSECVKLTDNGFKEFSEILQQTQTSNRFCDLSSLRLSVSGCLQITDSSADYLSQALKKASKLQNIELDFSVCEGMTAAGLKTFTDAFGNKDLKSLSLNFSSCNQMNDQGFTFIKYMINNQSLDSLSLNFSCCKQLTDICFETIFSARTIYKTLKILSLIFNNCPNLTDHCLSGMTQILESRSLTDLQRATLNFCGCEKFNDAGVGKLIERCDELKTLETCFMNLNCCPNITLSREVIDHMKRFNIKTSNEI